MLCLLCWGSHIFIFHGKRNLIFLWGRVLLGDCGFILAGVGVALAIMPEYSDAIIVVTIVCGCLLAGKIAIKSRGAVLATYAWILFG